MLQSAPGAESALCAEIGREDLKIQKIFFLPFLFFLESEFYDFESAQRDRFIWSVSYRLSKSNHRK